MAADTSVIEGLEGEDQEHHERSIQSRDAMGMGKHQSDSPCPSECEAFPNPNDPFSGTDQALFGEAGRSSEDGCVAWGYHRPPGRRTPRLEMGRCRFRDS